MTQKIAYLKIFLSIFICVFSVFAFNFQKVSAWTIIQNETVNIQAIVQDPYSPPNDLSGGSLNEEIKIPETAVRFSGLAYPMADVFVLKQGSVVASVKADEEGAFSVTLEEEYDSTILYSLYAIDKEGDRSLILNYPTVVVKGYLTHISGILLAPTISLDKSEALVGDYISIYGYALPEKRIELFIESQDKSSGKTFVLTTRDDGTYKIDAPLSSLPKGEYVVYIKYEGDSRLSKLVKFIIGDKSVLNIVKKPYIRGDCNKDDVINLVDFSVMAFWYKKQNPPECIDLNSDGVIDLIDFSILAFYWTG